MEEQQREKVLDAESGLATAGDITMTLAAGSSSGERRPSRKESEAETPNGENLW